MAAATEQEEEGPVQSKAPRHSRMAPVERVRLTRVYQDEDAGRIRAQQHPQLVSADQAKVFGIQNALHHPWAQLELDQGPVQSKALPLAPIAPVECVRLINGGQDEDAGRIRAQQHPQLVSLEAKVFGIQKALHHPRAQLEPDLLQQFGFVRVQLEPDLYVCAAHHFRNRMDENVKEVVAALVALH